MTRKFYYSFIYFTVQIVMPRNVLTLGLGETDEFWATPSEPWTSVKAWSGQNVAADHALDLNK